MRNGAIHCNDCPSRSKGVFCALGAPELDLLERAHHGLHHPKGSYIFLAGNPPLGIYALVSGKVKLTKVGRGGKRQIVRILGPGDLLGHRSLMADQPYRATAEALEDCRLCYVDKAAFFSVLRSSERAALAFYRKLCLDLGEAEESLYRLSRLSVKRRLAAILVDLQDRFGGADSILGVALTREELGDLAGTTLETAIRTFRSFQKFGWVEGRGNGLKILDRAPLEKLAGRDLS